MSAPAIPEEFEDGVYREVQRGAPYRAVSRWLESKHNIIASHEAVSSCVRRVGKQIEEADADLSASDTSPAAPTEKLVELDRLIGIQARKASRDGDTALAIKARMCQVRIAMKLMDMEQKESARARKEYEEGADVAENW